MGYVSFIEMFRRCRFHGNRLNIRFVVWHTTGRKQRRTYHTILPNYCAPRLVTKHSAALRISKRSLGSVAEVFNIFFFFWEGRSIEFFSWCPIQDTNYCSVLNGFDEKKSPRHATREHVRIVFPVKPPLTRIHFASVYREPCILMARENTAAHRKFKTTKPIRVAFEPDAARPKPVRVFRLSCDVVSNLNRATSDTTAAQQVRE